MNSRLPVWLLLAATLVLPLRSAERNAWPLLVAEEDARTGQLNPRQSLGPLFLDRLNPDGSTTQAFRPLILQTAKGDDSATYFLYPFFTWTKADGYSRFSFFRLVNDQRAHAEGARPAQRGFDIWPLYFSRQTGDPGTSYRALFPLAGTMKNRFGKDRLTWTVFPLYFHTEKNGLRITSAPWPFLRVIEGAGHRGFELWPLFGRREHPGDYRKQFYLWPLFYKHETRLADPQPDVKLGFFPFYTRDTGPGYRSESYLGPFFGYTDRTEPKPYHETRYFWPFLVQGRGEARYVNRWGPLYTHSIIKGYDKQWFLWPLFRHAEWQESGVAQTQDRLCFFLYWSLEQRSLANPAAAPARKEHLWPLYSAWDNGAGRKQLQLLSPLEVFFQNNDVVRQLYTPLFALYRWEQRAPGDTRGTVLWGLLSWKSAPEENEFHLGPLFSTHATPAGTRIALGNGLLSWRRETGTDRGRLRLFDFRSTPARPAPAAPTP